MSRYVDMDKIITELEYKWGYDGIREDLYYLPAADVQEVKHGRWLEDFGHKRGNFHVVPSARFFCSICKRRTGYKQIKSWNYCPNCGAIIKKRWGIEVEHVCAMTTYERCFYKPITKQAEGFENRIGLNRGFPYQKGAWCQRDLKVAALDGRRNKIKDIVQYLGIAADEPERIGQLSDKKVSPLVKAGWTEAMCREWCEANDLLSPIYTTATRGGCWFCHNQGVGQLRLLRRDYPDYWALMLKWDADSPVTFHADGHTVRDLERRFALEDQMLLDPEKPFRWSMLDGDLQMRIF